MSLKSVIAALVFVAISGAAYGQKFTSKYYLSTGVWWAEETDIYVNDDGFIVIADLWEQSLTRVYGDNYQHHLLYTNGWLEFGVNVEEVGDFFGGVQSVRGYSYTHTISVTSFLDYSTRVYFANLK